jgi:hypothetical protein
MGSFLFLEPLSLNFDRGTRLVSLLPTPLEEREMKIWAGSFLFFCCLALPALAAPVCHQSQNRNLMEAAPTSSSFLDEKHNQMVDQINDMMLRSTGKLHQLEDPKKGGLEFEDSLVELIRQATVEWKPTLEPSASINQRLIARVAGAIGFSKHLFFLDGQQAERMVESMLLELPPGSHDMQIKAELLQILGFFERFANPKQAELAEEFLTLQGQAEMAELYIEALAQASDQMPQIRNIGDFRKALFELPAQIQKELGVSTVTLHKILKAFEEYTQSDMKGFDFLTAGQQKALDDIRQLIQADPSLSKLSEKAQDKILTQISRMNSRESIAMVLAETVAREKPKLQDLVGKYRMLRRIQALVDAQMVRASDSRH